MENMDRNLIMELNLENSNVKKVSIQGQKEKVNLSKDYQR